MLVLVVEDEPLIGMMLDDWLEEMGHEILGPAATPASGRRVQSVHVVAGDLRIGGHERHPLD